MVYGRYIELLFLWFINQRSHHQPPTVDRNHSAIFLQVSPWVGPSGIPTSPLPFIFTMMPSAWKKSQSWDFRMVNGPQLSGMFTLLPLNFRRVLRITPENPGLHLGGSLGKNLEVRKHEFPGYDLPVNNGLVRLRISVFLLFGGCYNTAKVKGYPLNQKEDVDKNIDIYHIWWVDSMSLKTWCHRPCLNKKISSLWKKKKKLGVMKNPHHFQNYIK